MTAAFDPARCRELIAEARRQYGLVEVHGYGVRAGTMHDIADQLEVALAEIDRLETAREADADEAAATYATMSAEIEALRCGDLDAFHDGELDPARASVFRSHLAACAACETRLHGIMQEDTAIASSGNGGHRG